MISKRKFAFGLSLLVLAITYTQVSAQQANSDTTSAMRWRYIGPVGNRVTSIVGVPGQPYIYYAGSASGGIFKTNDGGIHWEPVSMHSPCRQSVRSRSRHQIRISSGPVPAKPGFAVIFQLGRE